MNMRQKLKLYEIIDNCQAALESYRMMLSDKQDIAICFDENDIENYKKTFNAVELTEEERMAIFSRFAHWRNKHYDTYAEIFMQPTISIDEFVRDCSVKLSNLKMSIKDIDNETVWPKLLVFLNPKKEETTDQSIIVKDTTRIIESIIVRIIEKTKPVHDRISALQKFEEISATKIPENEISVSEITTENNDVLISKINSFRSKEKIALENFLHMLKIFKEMAVGLKDKNSRPDENKFLTWLNTYGIKPDEQKKTSERLNC